MALAELIPHEIDKGGTRITNLGAPVNPNDAARLADVSAVGAPTDLTYWVSAPSGSLSNEVDLSAIGNGLLKVTAGAPSIAVAGTDYLAAGAISIASGQVAVGSGSNTLGGSASLTYESSTLSVAGNVQLNGPVSVGDGSGVIGVANAAALPTGTPTGGGVIFATGGHLYWRDSTGFNWPLSNIPVAPVGAQYWVGAANATLTQEHNLGALATGIVKNTAGTPSIAVAGTDYVAPSTAVNAGAGLSGGGDLTVSRTISMPNVGPGAGTIGGSGIASITLDAQGRVTAAATATYALGSQISIASGQVAYGTGANTIGGSASFTWDGTTLFTGNHSATPGTAAGWSLKLFDGGSLATSYGIGVEAGNTWFTSNGGYKFYVGTTTVRMELASSGALRLDNGANLGVLQRPDNTNAAFAVGNGVNNNYGGLALYNSAGSTVRGSFSDAGAFLFANGSGGSAAAGYGGFRYNESTNKLQWSQNNSAFVNLDAFATGSISIAANQIAYASGSNTLVGSAGFTWNGSTFSITSGPQVFLSVSNTTSNMLFNGNIGVGDGLGVIAIGNAAATPTGTHTGGGVLYASSGDLYWRNSAGTAYQLNAASGAPADATYWVGSANGTLSAEHNLGALGTGLVKNTSGTPSIAVAGTDYQAPITIAADRIAYATSTNTLGGSANLTYTAGILRNASVIQADTNGSTAAPSFSAGSGSNGIYVPATNALGFVNNAGESMRTTANRNLLIGTTTEDTGYRLKVADGYVLVETTNTDVDVIDLRGPKTDGSHLGIKWTESTGDATFGYIRCELDTSEGVNVGAEMRFGVFGSYVALEYGGGSPTLYPETDNQAFLGKSGKRWTSIYAATTNIGDLNMGYHDTDGEYSLREGPDGIYIQDKRTGRRGRLRIDWFDEDYDGYFPKAYAPKRASQENEKFC